MSLTPRRTFGPPGSDSGVGFYTLNDMFVPGSLNFVQVSINSRKPECRPVWRHNQASGLPVAS